MTLGMVQNNKGLSGNVPKWGQYPVGVFPGCNTKTLMCELSSNAEARILQNTNDAAPLTAKTLQRIASAVTGA